MIDVSNKIVEEIKTHILRSVTFFRKLCPLCDNVKKVCRAKEDAENMVPAFGILDK